MKADLQEELKTNGPRPLYLVDGEETLLVDEAVRVLKEHAIPKNARDFNFDVFTGKETKLVRIVEAAQTLPAFAPRRLVLVEGADVLDFDKSAVLLEYVEKPSPTTVLVFVGEKFDARTKVFKAFQKNGVVLRFPKAKLRDLPDLIRKRARAKNVKIDETGVRGLVDSIGADASAAYQALEILALYVGTNDRAITKADVEAVVSTTKEESIFALADAVGLEDRAGALRGLHAMLTVAREPALRVLAMIARHWRNLARTRSLLDAGVSPKEIEVQVGLLPFQTDNLVRQAKRHPVLRFATGLEHIAAADRSLKGGALADTRTMERLVLRLMSRASQAHVP